MEQENGVGAGQMGDGVVGAASGIEGANPMGAEQVVTEQVTVAQVDPVMPVEPVTPAEPAMPGPMVAEPKAPKKGHGMAIGLIFCLLLAAGGVGFGIWAWMDGNTQKDALNSQIAELKKQNNELRDKVSELNEKIDELEGGDEADEYISIEELGIKIKKSDDLPEMLFERQEGGSLTIKENQSASGLPGQVSLMKAITCDDKELTLGYSAKIDLDGTCYLVSEIVPYGVYEDYPLTDFLKYVTNPENYSKI